MPNFIELMKLVIFFIIFNSDELSVSNKKQQLRARVSLPANLKAHVLTEKQNKFIEY